MTLKIFCYRLSLNFCSTGKCSGHSNGDARSGECASLPVLSDEDSSSAKNDCPETSMPLCILCDDPVSVKLIPCGHSVICKLCVKRATRCPQCKVCAPE